MKVTSYLIFFYLFPGVFLPLPAMSQMDSPICYWRQSDGSVVDLSTLCEGNTTGNAEITLTPHEAFVTNFQAMIRQYPDEVRQALSSYITESSNSAIAAAKTTCRVLKFGGEGAAQRRQARLTANNASPIEKAKQDIIQTLAINHYCPEFASR